jgi:hypothetical protein
MAINRTLLTLTLTMSIAARTIIELNIKHYRELLTTESDPSKRRTLAKLLAEEEAKLAKLPVEKKEDK